MDKYKNMLQSRAISVTHKYNIRFCHIINIVEIVNETNSFLVFGETIKKLLYL